MKKMFLKITAVLFALLLSTQCSHVSIATANTYLPKVSTTYSRAIQKEIPTHRGRIHTGKLGDYGYKASDNMVEFGAPGDSGLYLISPIYVFDLSRMTPGLDALIIGDKDGHYRCSTLIKGEKVISSTISPEIQETWFGRANEVRRIVQKQKEDERAHKAREKSKQDKIDAAKWRNLQSEPLQPSNFWYKKPDTKNKWGSN